MVVHFNFGVGFEVVREQHDRHWNLIQIIYLEKQSGKNYFLHLKWTLHLQIFHILTVNDSMLVYTLF